MPSQLSGGGREFVFVNGALHPYVGAQKGPEVEGCRGALAPHPRRFAPAGGAIPISIRPDPEVH